MTDDDLDAIERVWSHVARPWRCALSESYEDVPHFLVVDATPRPVARLPAGTPRDNADAIAIAAAPEHVRVLIAECRRLRRAYERTDPRCATCGHFEDDHRGGACYGHDRHDGGCACYCVRYAR